jgi:hypothetical protein
VVTFHPNRASTFRNIWWSFSYYHNNNNAIIEHLHQGLNPKYTHVVLSDHPFSKRFVCWLILLYMIKKKDQEGTNIHLMSHSNSFLYQNNHNLVHACPCMIPHVPIIKRHVSKCMINIPSRRKVTQPKRSIVGSEY